jgi:hypothetical protein
MEAFIIEVWLCIIVFHQVDPLFVPNDELVISLLKLCVVSLDPRNDRAECDRGDFLSSTLSIDVFKAFADTLNNMLLSC